VVNRMGFNNDGAGAVLRRLAGRAHFGGIVGVNVGANKDSADRVADYVKLIEMFCAVASYFTVNVSFAEHAGLARPAAASALDDLLAKVIDAPRTRAAERQATSHGACSRSHTDLTSGPNSMMSFTSPARAGSTA